MNEKLSLLSYFMINIVYLNHGNDISIFHMPKCVFGNVSNIANIASAQNEHYWFCLPDFRIDSQLNTKVKD